MADRTIGRLYVSREGLGSARISAKSPIRHLDPFLIPAALALTAVGCVAVRSASAPLLQAQGMDPDYFLKRQLVFFCLSTIAFGIVLLFDYRRYAAYAPIIYAGMLVLLLVVLTPLGQRVAGAQRWLSLGVFQVQPAELMKVAYIGLLAALLSRETNRAGFAPVAQALIMAGVPALLVYAQPDLGSALVLFAIAFGMLLVAGVELRWLAVVVLLAATVAVLAIQLGVLRDYQVARLQAFLDTESDLQGSSFNLAQSKIAIGSGGFLGKGLGNGSQTNLSYVPEQRTDFIFTAIGEEMGFVGAMLVIGLFSLLLWRCVRIAMLSKDLFGTLVAAGVATMLGFQLFVNIGMTIGIMPITGIPLPFVSYGGSSLVTSYVGVAVVMNIHMRRFV
ncbi:MAG: rod shape-determining protein RodA [Actinomycetota bacterium]|nr:rod shape-determining protein RodA [Actinomycetota bacterium]